MMNIFRRFLWVIFLCATLQNCSCGSREAARFRLGVDPNWYPLDFGPQTPYVNGFIEELLIDMAAYSGMEFELVQANWDSLLEGMKQGKYDAVLSSLPPYNYHLAKYDFSENFLDLGPILIVPTGSSYANLDQMKEELVGCIVGDPAVLQLQKHPDVILRTYPSISDLLQAVVTGEIEGALLDRMLASAYLRDFYQGQLVAVGAPMTDAGLHLITPRGKQGYFVRSFNKNLEVFKKKKKWQALLEKWQIG
jgi:ABC-type amino acid transport substrate-binding protein